MHMSIQKETSTKKYYSNVAVPWKCTHSSPPFYCSTHCLDLRCGVEGTHGVRAQIKCKLWPISQFPAGVVVPQLPTTSSRSMLLVCAMIMLLSRIREQIGHYIAESTEKATILTILLHCNQLQFSLPGSRAAERFQRAWGKTAIRG